MNLKYSDRLPFLMSQIMSFEFYQNLITYYELKCKNAWFVYAYVSLFETIWEFIWICMQKKAY